MTRKAKLRAMEDAMEIVGGLRDDVGPHLDRQEKAFRDEVSQKLDTAYLAMEAVFEALERTST